MHDESSEVEVHVGPAQREQLTEPQPGVRPKRMVQFLRRPRSNQPYTEYTNCDSLVDNRYPTAHKSAGFTDISPAGPAVACPRKRRRVHTGTVNRFAMPCRRTESTCLPSTAWPTAANGFAAALAGVECKYRSRRPRFVN